jgi:hypothetical protein
MIDCSTALLWAIVAGPAGRQFSFDPGWLLRALAGAAATSALKILDLAGVEID